MHACLHVGPSCLYVRGGRPGIAGVRRGCYSAHNLPPPVVPVAVSCLSTDTPWAPLPSRGPPKSPPLLPPACSRCTGYRPILDAFKAFAKVDAAAYTEEAIAASKAAAANGGGSSNGTAANGSSSGGGAGSNGANGGSSGSSGKAKGPICPSTGKPCDCGQVDAATGDVVSASKHKEAACGPLTHTRPAVEPIFPPELRKRQAAELALTGPRCAWHRPVTLDRLLQLKRQHPAAKLVVGNTGGSMRAVGGAVCEVCAGRLPA